MKMKSENTMVLLVTVIGLLILNVVKGSTEECFGGVRALDVIDVFNGQSLESYLRLPDSSGSVARLSLINGTQWATLGGGVKDFGLVLGKPPSTSSDTTLKEALKSFNTSASRQSNIIIDYEQSNLLELVLQNIADIGAISNTKLWVFRSREDVAAFNEVEANPTLQNIGSAIRMPKVGFGLDKVFSRVLDESFLLPFDFARIQKILSDVFSLKEVDSSEVLYLKRKQKVVNKRHRSSFTELYLSNIVHLLADDNSRALNKFRTDPLGNPLIFMPDLQQTDAVYTRDEVQQVEDWLSSAGKGTHSLTSDDCVVLELRGGAFTQNESLQNIKGLTERHPGLRLLVRVDPYDAPVVDTEKLVSAIKIVGAHKVLAQVPSYINSKMREIDSSLMAGSSSLPAASAASPVGERRSDGPTTSKSSGSPRFSSLMCLMLPTITFLRK